MSNSHIISSTIGKKDIVTGLNSKCKKLPWIKINCPLNIDIVAIHQLFNSISYSLRFGIIDSEENFSTAVYRKSWSIKTLIQYCCKNKELDNITAIKLEITLDEAKFTRQIKLKGLYGVHIFIKI